jgi:sulfate permease, SulP family
MKTGDPSGDNLNLWPSQWLASLSPAQIIPILTSTLMVWLLQMILAISFAALIYSGPLSAFVGYGIGLALAGAALSGIAIALLSSLPGMAGGAQDVPAAIMAISVAALVASLPAGVESEAMFVTAVVAVGLTTALTGLLHFALGQFRLGSLVRFLPYPVLGGFLAGTGWLLMHGALGIMVDAVPPLASLATLFQPDQLLRWLPGVSLGVVIYIVLNRTATTLALPATVLGAAALFYAIVALSGAGLDGASAGGWLLGPFPSGNLWPSLSLADLAQVHWPSLAPQLVSVVTIALMSAVAVLLNASGLELTTQREVNLNRELQAAGAGNLGAGLLGGLVGYQQLSISAMNHKVSGGSRLAPLAGALLCGLALFVGGEALSLFPKMVLGGLLFYLGFSFFVEWVVHTWPVMPRTDYAIILLILLVTTVAGFLQAVGVGLVVAVALFVVNYSRIDIVRDELSGAHIQSRVTRRPAQQLLLQEQGAQRHILRLQGYIFFGTADRLLDRVRRRLEHPQRTPPHYLLLDFSRVTGIDSTALWSFRRLEQLARAQNVTIVLAGVPASIRRSLTGGNDFAAGLPIFPDLDRACEWCETQLLAELDAGETSSAPDPLHQELVRILKSEELVARLLSFFQRQAFAAGEYLMRQGDPPDLLYLIESGQVTAQLEREGSEPARLQTMEGGHVLGELGFFLGMERTAAVVAETPSVVYCLSTQALEQMRAADPEVATAFHQLILHLLAERVVHLVGAVNALQR